MSYLIAGNIVTTLEGGISFIEYPDYFSLAKGSSRGLEKSASMFRAS